MLPFQNEVTIVRLSAADLFAVLEVSISGLAAVTAVSAPHGRFLQVAGLRFEWWYESGGIPLVHTVQLEGSDGTLRPLSRRRSYARWTPAASSPKRTPPALDPGYLWLGADAVTQPQTFDSVELAPSATQRERIAQGFFGTTAAEPSGTRYHNFLTRLRAMPSTSDATSPGSCNLQLDDEGGSYVWAQDHDGNASTQLLCAGFNATSISEWAAYEYDAVYALAHAIHDLLEVQQKSAIVGAELIAALMERVSFEGVTGPIDLHTGDSNGVYGANTYRGDRQVGVVYDVKNVDASGQLVTVGKWAPCATCSFAQRWKQVAPLVYSTGGATPPCC